MGAEGLLSEQTLLYASFQKLMETMKYKTETPKQAARTEAQTERTPGGAAGWLDSAVFGSLKRHGSEEQMETCAVLREALWPVRPAPWNRLVLSRNLSPGEE